MVRRSSSKSKISLSKRNIINYERKPSNSPSTSDDSTESTTLMKDKKFKSSSNNTNSRKTMIYCSNSNKTH